MSDLRWYLPLEHCTTLDDVRSRWQELLERSRMAPFHNVPRYEDAMLSFLGTSALAPWLKLAAVLACGSAFDFDFRLAVGLLKEQIDELDAAWPATVAAAVGDNGPALPIATSDAWLGAFIAGRLAGLRETFGHDGTRADNWRAAFWNRYLEMACRHADAEGVARALRHGADPRADGHAAILTPARGVHRGFLPESGHLTPGRSNADYQSILLQLLEGGLPRTEMLAAALPAAAGADNTDMLDFLLAQGADMRADGAPALAAAARNMAVEALAWLLAHGADVHAEDGAALLAGVASLHVGTVEMLLAAGADLQAASSLAFRTALTSRPHDFYSDESDLVDERADMLVFLLAQGMRPSGADAVDALKAEFYARRVIDAAAGHEGIALADAELLRVLAERAWGPGSAA
ncbi:ankyrin repeat domain-containing protein [Massilia sp. LjRoot122]|uniref:ankyrin repeat domain-containing protein n=1 Tax=Massilia sp. LjRoot122 TaxID=3342257 RepID=UPI003ED140BD